MTDKIEVKPEDRAAAWEAYVRGQVSSVLDTYLPEAITGNIGVKYINPVLRVDAQTGEKVIDTKTALGVQVILEFTFAAPIKFFDEEPKAV
jgi:hypothetical protein